MAEDQTYCRYHTPAMYGFQSYISTPIILADGSFWGTLCAIDPRLARANNPETIGMFKLFAEPIGFHLNASERLAASEANLLDERKTSESPFENTNSEYLKPMTKDIIWISLPVIGFCLGLLPKPKIVFSIVTACAVSATAYILSGYQAEQQGVLFGAVMIGGPLAAGLVTVGALIGSWGRKYAANGKARYTLLIAAIIFSSVAFLVFNSVQHEQAMIDQERLALEFVKQSKEVVQEVGSDADVNVLMHRLQKDTTIGYDIFVRGAKILYVSVEVSRQAGKPIFSLVCIRNTSQRDRYEHSCKR